MKCNERNIHAPLKRYCQRQSQCASFYSVHFNYDFRYSNGILLAGTREVEHVL